MPVRWILPFALSAWWTASTPVSAAPATDAPPPESFRAVVERPLFRPDRRPVPVAVVPQETPPVLRVEPPAIDFIGTLRRDGRILALVAGISPKLQELEPGAEVDGWRVVSVEPRRMVLERNGDLLEYRLRPEGGGP